MATGDRQWGRSMSVLVVDGNHDAADSLALLLQMYGHESRVAYNGPDALRAVEAELPDAVIFELLLAGMDGRELAKRIRERCGSRPPPLLVVVTGYTPVADEAAVPTDGSDHRFVKPTDPTLVTNLLRFYAERRVIPASNESRHTRPCVAQPPG